MDIGERIAHRLREERKRRGWSLDALAAHSRVSRAMISKIERGTSTPTAVLLARLADAMGMTLSSLMFETRPQAQGVTRLGDQAQWTDPASGYTRRHVSPAAGEGDAEIVAVDLPAGAHLHFAAAHSFRIDGKVLLLQGSLQLSIGGEKMCLEPGDCAGVALHLEHRLHNPGVRSARYLVVMRRFDLSPGLGSKKVP